MFYCKSFTPLQYDRLHTHTHTSAVHYIRVPLQNNINSSSTPVNEYFCKKLTSTFYFILTRPAVHYLPSGIDDFFFLFRKKYLQHVIIIMWFIANRFGVKLKKFIFLRISTCLKLNQVTFNYVEWHFV